MAVKVPVDSSGKSVLLNYSSAQHPKRRLPELLSPAGNWACARAAVENGADAIYFALGKFNARIRAENFSIEDLPALMDYVHKHGVRGYACLNTLVFEDELDEVESYLRAMIMAGVDAVLVQDVGVAQLVRRISPDFPIHASTQMTITSAAGVEFAHELGCALVVLSRECNIRDIISIQQATSALVPPICLEVFVHGALCISYSGQCFASRALGGRSANRGDCAQPCRLPYKLVCDGKEVDLGGQRYLLSANDLAAIELLPHLVRAGIASLKIEGRLKSPEYVAAITRIYRNALDALAPVDDEVSCAADSAKTTQQDELWYEMQMAFSRGLCTGWLKDTDHQKVVHGRFGKHHGALVGKVVCIRGNRVFVELIQEVKPGDGVVFCTGESSDDEPGGRVYSVRALPEKWAGGPELGSGAEDENLRRHRRSAELTFRAGAIDISRLKPGTEVWKTSDPALERKWQSMARHTKARYRRPIWFEVSGQLGEPVEVRARDELGNEATALSSVPLCAARNAALTEELLTEKLGRLGETQFRLGGLKSKLPPESMLPLSELNRLRRVLVSELERIRSTAPRWQISSEPVSSYLQHRSMNGDQSQKLAPELILLVRGVDQFRAALETGVRVVYCEFPNLEEYRKAVELRDTLAAKVHGEERLCSAGELPRPAGHHAPALFAVPPRICRPGEEAILEIIRKCGADGYVARNFDHLKYFVGTRCVGDFSLNVANSLSVTYLKGRFNLERVTASYDMDVHHLELLLKSVPPAWIEIVVHQHIPMLHMEHCVFCAFLSNRRNRTDCDQPCRLHRVYLRDRVGDEHPVQADICCRNTVFQGPAKSAAEHIGRFLELGARYFRIEFLDETPDEVRRITARYFELLRAHEGKSRSVG